MRGGGLERAGGDRYHLGMRLQWNATSLLLALALIAGCGGGSSADPDNGLRDDGVPDIGTLDSSVPMDMSNEGCDEDGDGVDSVACGGSDCDDLDEDRFPGNLEVCDAADLDEDCDGSTFGDSDVDQDGFHDDSCCNGQGQDRVCGDDCHDGDRAIHPNQADTCGDSINQDCDELTDEGGLLYLDLDHDGRGDPATGMTRVCSAGLVANGDDCDDDDDTVYGGPIPAPESCNGVDNDCSGDDEDADEDGHVTPTTVCTGGFPKDDCNDAVATVYPGADEVCDGYDSDCSAGGGPVAGEDDDGDGHAPLNATCDLSTPRDDCNDDDDTVYASALELCDEVDNDCDAMTSELGLACGASNYCVSEGRCLAQEVEEIAAGNAHTCARFGELVRCWGYNGDGQLGDGTNMTRLVPVTVPGLAGVVDIESGANHMCALLSDTTVTCWGNNDSGQLGDGMATDRLSPTPVPGLSGVVEITASYRHTCARLMNGTVRCWGSNSTGQFGDGTMMSRLSPTAMPALTGMRLFSGYEHTCARLSDATASCWGSNLTGQLGDDTNTQRLSPTPVLDLTSVAGLEGNVGHSCAWLTGGTAYCWGSNGSNQLGDGTSTPRLRPALVTGLTGVAEVSVGAFHSCARLTGGTVQCWSLNLNGQVGDGTMTQRTSPTAVSGLSGVVAISAGSLHTCALLNDGTVRCWGEGNNGQLGDGMMTRRLSPTMVMGLD